MIPTGLYMNLAEISYLNDLVKSGKWELTDRRDSLNFTITDIDEVYQIERMEYAIPRGSSGGKYILTRLPDGVTLKKSDKLQDILDELKSMEVI
jgi:hypothetical protein